MKINQLGFTLTETLVVLAIFGTIASLSVGFLWGIGRSDALLATTREVIGVLHEAHANSISGRSVDGQQATSYGVYFQAGYYVLFNGSTYNSNDTNNSRSDLQTGISFSQIQLPNSAIVFSRVSGHVSNFNATQNYVELLDNNTLETKRITISQVGSIKYE